MVKEIDGTRYFEQISQWRALDYTIVAKRNRFAQYADNPGADRLFLTYFRIDNKNIFPFNKFIELDQPIILADGTKLVRRDPETNEYLEFDKAQDRIRLYREV